MSEHRCKAGYVQLEDDKIITSRVGLESYAGSGERVWWRFCPECGRDLRVQSPLNAQHGEPLADARMDALLESFVLSHQRMKDAILLAGEEFKWVLRELQGDQTT